jgi:hypothetical protein
MYRSTLILNNWAIYLMTSSSKTAIPSSICEFSDYFVDITLNPAKETKISYSTSSFTQKKIRNEH